MVFVNTRKFSDPKKTERIFSDLSIYGRAYTTDMELVRSIAKRKEIRDASKSNFLDIVHSRKKSRTVFVLPPNIKLIPRINEREIRYYFKRLKIFE